jgi:phytoene dehydrogenase-like protein
VSSREKKMIVIGGGIAGLCAGINARRAGFQTEILEMHAIAGGLAAAWKRNGYTFKNCVHWLVGSKKGTDLYDWWREVFDIDQIEFYESLTTPDKSETTSLHNPWCSEFPHARAVDQPWRRAAIRPHDRTERDSETASRELNSISTLPC